MGVFKKLKGDDVRVTPLTIKFKKSAYSVDNYMGINKNPVGSSSADINDFYDSGGVGVENFALLYNSIRQLYYGSFITQNFLSSGSAFSTGISGSVDQKHLGTFSRFDPSFQGSLSYLRYFPTQSDGGIRVHTIPTSDFGESIVPGTISASNVTDDATGNLLDSSGNVKGNIFYDQGIIVTTGTNGDGYGPITLSSIDFFGSYTVYATQYKCTAGPNEFNASMNPTLLTTSSTEYDQSIIDSPEFMPYVTTIGLYNENQELMMVAKLGQPVQLNPYTDTNFIVRIDK